jgi:hypothetical protein
MAANAAANPSASAGAGGLFNYSQPAIAFSTPLQGTGAGAGVADAVSAGGFVPTAPQLSTPAASHLSALIKQKEKELTELSEARARTADEVTTKLERARAEAVAKYERLRTDFDFNLRLIEERDTELDRHEALAAHYKTTITERDKMIGDLRISLTDAESKNKQIEAHVSELIVGHGKQMRQLQDELESSRRDREVDARKHRDAFDAAKREWQRTLREKDDSIDAIRKQLQADYEKVFFVLCLFVLLWRFRRHVTQLSSRAFSAY